MTGPAWPLRGYAPILLTPDRAITIAAQLVCPACKTLHFGAEYVTGEAFCKCQQKRCTRQRWWATPIYPGSIGATLIAVFGTTSWRLALALLHPQSQTVSDDDAMGWELQAGYLEIPLTAHEYTRGVADAIMEGRDRLRRLARSA